MNIYAKQKSPSLSRLPSPKAANVHNRGWSGPLQTIPPFLYNFLLLFIPLLGYYY